VPGLKLDEGMVRKKTQVHLDSGAALCPIHPKGAWGTIMYIGVF